MSNCPEMINLLNSEFYEMYLYFVKIAYLMDSKHSVLFLLHDLYLLQYVAEFRTCMFMELLISHAC